MLLPAIPDIIGEFKILYNTSSWMLTAYLIAGAVMTLIRVKAVRNGRYYYLL